jgi:hypothetical protein
MLRDTEPTRLCNLSGFTQYHLGHDRSFGYVNTAK